MIENNNGNITIAGLTVDQAVGSVMLVVCLLWLAWTYRAPALAWLGFAPATPTREIFEFYNQDVHGDFSPLAPVIELRGPAASKGTGFPSAS